MCALELAGVCSDISPAHNLVHYFLILGQLISLSLSLDQISQLWRFGEWILGRVKFGEQAEHGCDAAESTF